MTYDWFFFCHNLCSFPATWATTCCLFLGCRVWVHNSKLTELIHDEHFPVKTRVLSWHPGKVPFPCSALAQTHVCRSQRPQEAQAWRQTTIHGDDCRRFNEASSDSEGTWTSRCYIKSEYFLHVECDAIARLEILTSSNVVQVPANNSRRQCYERTFVFMLWSPDNGKRPHVDARPHSLTIATRRNTLPVTMPFIERIKTCEGNIV